MKKEKFWNFVAKNYDDEVGEQTVGITRKYLNPGDSVLDYGCARGAYTAALAGDVGEIRGIDISPKMIELAKEMHEGIRFDTATIEDIDEQYDVVLAYNILHLVDNVDEVIQKIDSILKPGGRFISATACMKETLGIRLAGTLAGLLGIASREKFTVQELKDMISERFEIAETEYFERHHVLIVAKK